MSLKNLNLGDLVKGVISTEFYLREFTKGMSAPGRKVSEYEREEVRKTEEKLKGFYSELKNREEIYKNLKTI